jgi:hypothetical protein
MVISPHPASCNPPPKHRPNTLRSTSPPAISDFVSPNTRVPDGRRARRAARTFAQLRESFADTLRAAAEHVESEKAAKLAQTLGQLQSFTTVLPQEYTGQLASFGPT